MKYFIVEKNKHKDFDFKNSPNKSDTVRWNLDKTKFIIKFQDDKIPAGMTNGYSNAEITEIMRDEEQGFYDNNNLL